ncbi:DUF58 domain-containing protein [Arthrobacter sp. H20]|uniref:DUF58 domain-containing protein n=1 Tax=Arthrobacter sp. H20 TaxID=1267981 RepID=UPI0006851985|nr:DUF58 domain-containing protein [Arthrobacter sp. H20]
MQLLTRLPSRVLTPRGWGLVFAGVTALLLAQVLGRRDLLYVGVLLVCLPLLSVLMLRLIKPRFIVEREFAPQTIETSFTTTVTLTVASSGPVSGSVVMQEVLPSRFGETPEFRFPSRHPTRGASRYQYHLRSSGRGVFDVGPVTAAFTDPFGLGTSRHSLGDADRLLVTPAPLDLPNSQLTGARGADGFAATRRNANPSDDDVMTREYRPGDPMRRVHWAATARHNELMVRQEESVTTPEATLILDQRQARYSSGLLGAFGADREEDGTSLLSSPGFEWAVVAAMSITAHLLERNYALRFVDETGAPALRSSVSAPWPEDEEHAGQTGIHNVAEGLAALELFPDPSRRAPSRRRAGRRTAPAQLTARGAPFGDPIMDKLAAYKNRGPLLALLGAITASEARELAAAAEYGSASFAILIADRPQDLHQVMEILRASGWHAVAVSPTADLTATWTFFDSHGGASASTAKTTVVSSTRGGRP